MSKRPAPKKTRATAAPEVEISYAFGFDAAHRFATTRSGHKYSGIHGHSFQCQVTLRGTPRAPHGFVADLGQVERSCLALRKQLDHKLLNKIKYLNNPSLEHLAIWIWQRLATKLPGLARVSVRRDSLGQACSYSGPLAKAH
ncbi:MAG TPA: 6-carboxytetrahydropterin synthase [Burkholderiales bacterium]|nr:6-carboxytetrahydropterin synthase [Burkholderiales bacterium]